MIVVFFIIGFIGAFFTWKKLSKHYIAKGRNKYISHILGIAIGFIVWSLISMIGAAIFEPIQTNTEKSVSSNVSQSVLEKDSYLADQKLTEELIKSVSNQISSVSIYEQYAGKNKGFNNIDIHISTKMFWGGAQDWNGVALAIFDLSKTLLQRKDVVKISYVVWNNDHSLDWARIEVDRTLLPQEWEELTYLEFFSYTKPMSGSVDAEQWLTEFYSKYNSAIPKELR